jgi:hypothetical protein
MDIHGYDDSLTPAMFSFRFGETEKGIEVKTLLDTGNRSEGMNVVDMEIARN